MFVNYLLWCFAIFVNLIIVIQSQNCNKETCGSCLQEPECIWCIEPNVLENDTAVYCREKNHGNANWCPLDKLVEENPVFTIHADAPLSQTGETIVQIQPQRVHLRIRSGQDYKINFKYQQVNDYPVDLYFLMDLSVSMQPYLESLGKLGGQLAVEMKKLTKNFRLGFGSFVDKRDLPFVNTYPPYLDNPCYKTGANITCVKAYSFKNHLSLTSSDSDFTQQVQQAPISGNIDSPEGGFDALMQAMVCHDEIGWRPEARHLIVFASDAHFHIAGDGKLAGVVEPNDATCHMVNNDYEKDLKYDYPSISHINYIAKENNINIMFAIVKNAEKMYSIYESLTESIENSRLGVFSKSDDHNIVNLITENYNKIMDTVTLTDNATSSIKLTYSSNCSTITTGATCSQVQLGQRLDFSITLRPLTCAASQTITIKPGGLRASLTLHVDVVCECLCERPNHDDYHPAAPYCNHKGTQQCGVCRCDGGRYGHHCECDDSSTSTADSAQCVADDGGGGVVCSGLGTCYCGKCICKIRDDPTQIISGKYCECDNYSCRRHQSSICAGSANGLCVCGRCQCFADWTGDACQCQNTNSTCIALRSSDGELTVITGDGKQSGGEICSGRGQCVCGECKCNDSNYSGEFCEECANCPAQKCDQLKACVECKAYQIGLSLEDCDMQCAHIKLAKVPQTVQLSEDDSENGGNVKICRFTSDDCTAVFTYQYIDKTTFNITAVEERYCSNSWKVISTLLLIIIGTVLLAGLVLLVIWKLTTTVLDRKEYAKFEDERQQSKWHRSENPLFKSPVNKFSNPTFNRKSIWRNSVRNSTESTK